MIIKKIVSSATEAGISFALLVSTIVPVMGLMTPASASAQQGGGGGPTEPIFSSSYISSPTDPLVKKIGISFSSSTAYTGEYSFDLSVAKTSTPAIDGYFTFKTYSDKIVATCFINGDAAKPRMSYSWMSGDYTNTTLGSVVGTTGIDKCGFTYTHAFVPSTTYIISLDVTVAGTVSVRFKDGVAVEGNVVDITEAVDKPASSDYFVTSGTANTNCSTITALNLSVQFLHAGAAVANTLSKAVGPCLNFDISTYDAVTKITNIKFLAGNTPGIVSQHTISYVPTMGAYTSLDIFTVGSKNLKDYLGYNNAAAQQVYYAKYMGADYEGYAKDQQALVAAGIFDLSSADVDGSKVLMDTSLTNHKAFAHNFAGLTKGKAFTLYIPYKDADNFVGLCSGAADFASVSNKCTGIYYLKDGQTKTSKDTKSIPTGGSVKATIVTINGSKFWQVDGLTGTGGFSTTLASDPATGISISTVSTPVMVSMVIVTLGLAFAARRYSLKK